MKNEKTTLNPEIKEQFEKLDLLIKQEVEKSHEDTLAQAISKEWGEYLKNSKGYDMLDYAAILSKTESEKARYSLEDAFVSIHDEEAEKLTHLYQNALKVTGFWFDKDMSLERKFELFDIYMQQLREAAETVYDEIDMLWRFRSKNYRTEIEELKNKLNKVS